MLHNVPAFINIPMSNVLAFTSTLGAKQQAKNAQSWHLVFLALIPSVKRVLIRANSELLARPKPKFWAFSTNWVQFFQKIGCLFNNRKIIHQASFSHLTRYLNFLNYVYA
jgi:hypothetical protein